MLAAQKLARGESDASCCWGRKRFKGSAAGHLWLAAIGLVVVFPGLSRHCEAAFPRWSGTAGQDWLTSPSLWTSTASGTSYPVAGDWVYTSAGGPRSLSLSGTALASGEFYIVYVANATSGAADAILTLNSGALLNTQIFQVVGSATSNGVLTMNGGVLNVSLATAGNGFKMNSTTSGTATVNLNGGTISTPFFGNATGGTINFFANGGTIQARQNWTGSDFFGSMGGGIQVRNGGLTFDTQSFDVLVSSTLVNAGGTSTGGLTTVGSGTMRLTAANTYSGTTSHMAGTLAVGNVNALQNSTLSVGSAVTFIVAGTNTYNLGGLAGATNLAVGSNSVSVGGNGASTTYSGVLSGSGSLAKVGAGDLTLTGSNTYSGNTTISAGRLQIGSAGAINATSGITINGVGAELKYNSATALTKPITFTKGTLSGTGTINTLVTVGSGDIHSPGNSPGIQTVANETWDTGGTYLWEINDWNGTAGNVTNGFDQIAVTGTLNVAATNLSKFTVAITGLTGGNAVGIVPNFSNAARKTFTIATSSSLTNFAANKFTLDASSFSGSNSLNNGGFTIGNSANDVVLTYIPSAVYDLTANATATAIRVGGTSTITATITSSTATVTNPDSLAYTGLSLPYGLGTISASGTLAGGATASGSVAFTTVATGSYTFTPALTSGSNVSINTAANAGSTSGPTVLVYNPATVNTLPAVSLGNIHANDSFSTQNLSIWNTGTASATYQEGLAASISGMSGGASGSGSIGNLFTSSTSTAIAVGLAGASTATGGVRSGTVTLGFTSTGTTSGGATGLSPLSLGSQAVAVTGTVWNYAAANTVSGSYNLGTVLKGTPLSQTLSISNTAVNDGYSEKLDASFGATTGLASGSGSWSLLSAGGTSTALSVYLASGSAGSASGSQTVNFTSDGAGTSGLGTTTLGSQTVTLTATILDPALASFASGSTATTSLLIDFGSVNQNSSVSPLGFSLFNLMQASGFTADLALLNILSGTGNTEAIATTLSGTFNNLSAGDVIGYQASLSTANLGSFTNIYMLQFKSANDGTVYTGDAQQNLTLTVKGVIIVPEPGAVALAGCGVALAGWMVARRNRRR